jgi:predicted RNA-binding protein YlqC (UPF0109 family)
VRRGGRDWEDEMASELRDFVEILVKALVDIPEEVRITEIPGSTAVLLELHVAPSDVGKVVGKHGRNLQALRTLVEACGAKEGRKAFLELIEPTHRATPD